MKKEKLLNLDQRKFIEEWVGKISNRKISEKINKSECCIYYELKKNEKPYNALKAQERADQAMKEKMSRMCKSSKRYKNSHRQLSFLAEEKQTTSQEPIKKTKPSIDDSLENRIRNIEFQIEIILDVLKEIRK